MNRDPLDQLDQYFTSVHHAPLPPSLTNTSRRLNALIPLMGLALGASMAIVIALLPPAPKAHEVRDIARSIAERQLPVERSEPQHRSQLGGTTWGA